jgi:diaminopimelate epimerase
MKTIRFAKLSGAGNDFIVIDNRRKILTAPPARLARAFCRAKTGIGADGLLLLERSKRARFKMRIFNPDGSEAEMCGNGARCISRFAYQQKIAPSRMVFETKAGLIGAAVKGTEVKLRLSAPHDLRELKMILDGAVREIFFINTGVPHAVTFVRRIEKLDVVAWGRTIRNHALFRPAGTNADFVAKIDGHNIAVRTYERGVEDETLACGTGSVAAALVSAREMGLLSPVRVHTRGGDVLRIYFRLQDGKFSEVYLAGAVKYLFDGILKEVANV